MSDLPVDEPTDTYEEILVATYRSLEEHGYAALTIERIGEQMGTSPSIIYHYFDDKDDLVLSALEYLLDSFDTTLLAPEAADPRSELEEFVHFPYSEDADTVTTLLELRGQAMHDGDYRDHFTRSDAIFRTHLTDLIERGIETGAFAHDSPSQMAELLIVQTIGSLMRRATAETTDWQVASREQLDRMLAACLYVEE